MGTIPIILFGLSYKVCLSTFIPIADAVITIVGISTVGGLLSPVVKLMIFSMDSLINCTEAKLITTDNITIAIGSNFVRPEKGKQTIANCF